MLTIVNKYVYLVIIFVDWKEKKSAKTCWTDRPRDRRSNARMYGLHTPTGQDLQRDGSWHFQDSFEEIAKDPEMTGETYKVLMYLYSKLDFENFIQQSQMDIAEGLGIQKQKSLKSNEGTNFKTNRTWRPKKLAGRDVTGWILTTDGKAKLKPLQELRKGTIQSHRRWQRVNLIYSIWRQFLLSRACSRSEILDHIQLIHHGHQQELIQ